MSYLTVEEMEELVKVIDTSNNDGYRDYIIIVTMHETAVRVSELINIKLLILG